jgi:hypothetical protein
MPLASRMVIVCNGGESIYPQHLHVRLTFHEAGKGIRPKKITRF